MTGPPPCLLTLLYIVLELDVCRSSFAAAETGLQLEAFATKPADLSSVSLSCNLFSDLHPKIESRACTQAHKISKERM